MTKESILQECITIFHVNMPNDRASKYIKPKLTELLEEMDLLLWSVMNRSCRQKSGRT
jgi:hypothetical protein